MAQTVKNLPSMQKTRVWSLCREDSLEKGMATTPVFLSGEFHRQRSLVGYSSWGTKSQTWLNNTFTSMCLFWDPVSPLCLPPNSALSFRFLLKFFSVPYKHTSVFYPKQTVTVQFLSYSYQFSQKRNLYLLTPLPLVNLWYWVSYDSSKLHSFFLFKCVFSFPLGKEYVTLFLLSMC